MEKLFFSVIFGALVCFADAYVLVQNPRFYQKECGSCHTAYQPEFLPKASWNKLLSEQNNHFGENLELTQKNVAELREYLNSRAADVSGTKVAYKFVHNDGIYISKNAYFIKEHRKISQESLARQGLKSLANCGTCHKQADLGLYDDQ